MDLHLATIWWLAAGLAVVAELVTGSFYLLMIAIGLAAGAVAAHLGAPLAVQWLAAAVLGGGGTAAWHRRRLAQPPSAPASENRDVNLDIGDRVHVIAWSAEGTARVSHRGSDWTARLTPGAIATPGSHRIVAVEGNWLVLAPLAAAMAPTP